MKVLVLTSFVGFSQYYDLSGDIYFDLSVANSPYRVIDDIEVPPGISVAIEAGVVIHFQNGYEFVVNGTLAVQGNSLYPVLFTVENANDRWRGINFTNNSNYNSFEYCIIEYVEKLPSLCFIDFNGCGAVYLENSNNTTFSNCIFRENKTCYGAAIAFNESKADIENCEFYDNVAGENGGAIMIHNSDYNSTITGSIFERNTAGERGGAIWIHDATNVFIGDLSQFSENIANCNNTSEGGGGIAVTNANLESTVTIDDCNIGINHALQGGNGGGIYAKQSGGVNTAVTLTISNSEIYSNTADNNGGGIYLENIQAEMELTFNYINRNEAENGAGIYMKDLIITNTLPVADNRIEENEAVYSGGGIYFENTEISNMARNRFAQNQATSGGGIYFDESEVTNIRLGQFTGNVAGSNGGGVYLDHSLAEFRLCEFFTNNVSNDGGAVYIIGTHAGQQSNVFLNCLITDNQSGSNGGGIYSHVAFESYSNTIANNTAVNTGGGIYIQGGQTPVVTNTILWGNTATSNPNAYPTPDETNGGYSYSCSPVINNPLAPTTCTTDDPDFVSVLNGDYRISSMSSCYNAGDDNATKTYYDLDEKARIFRDTIDIGAYEARYIRVSGNICDQNWTNHNLSGVDYVITNHLLVQSGCSLSIDTGTIIEVYPAKKIDIEGSISAIGDANAYITFSATDTSSGWGGIRFGNLTTSYGGISSFEYCDISKVMKTSPPANNTADNPDYSGAVFVYGNSNTEILFDHCNIHHNQVSSHGGGILCYDCPEDVIIQYSNIYNNEAKIKGGGISLKGNTSAIVQNNYIYSNETYFGGGGIWICAHYNYPNPAPLISNNHIYTNVTYGIQPAGVSLGNGGGIGCTHSNADIYHNTIYNNASVYGGSNGTGFGGGISSIASEDLVIRNNTIYGNSAVYGGGISLSYTQASIYSNFIYNSNTATGDGGGIHINKSEPIIYNNLIANNTATYNGGGIYDSNSTAEIYNCTIADNSVTNGSGGGYFCPNTSSNPIFKNDIIYFNSPSPNYNNDFSYDGSGADHQINDITFCDIPAGSWSTFGGTGNITDDPHFFNSNGDYRISYDNGSPCIGRGDNGVTSQTSTDLKGDPRIYPVSGGTIDIGAYEYENPVPPGPSDPHYKKIENDSISIDIYFRDIVVYPNPAEHGFIILFNSETEESMNISMLNSLGQEVVKKSFMSHKGDNSFYLERGTLSAGCYYLQIDSETFNSKRMVLVFK